jgi:KUP system potassium uptake protein
MVGPQAADDFGHSEQDQHESHAPKGSLLALCVGTVGVVFGDIGTSPIYAFRETFAGHHPITPDPTHINGVLSLVFWSMMIVVTFKYVFTIMKADNKGEGGSLALLALINRQTAGAKWTAPFSQPHYSTAIP